MAERERRTQELLKSCEVRLVTVFASLCVSASTARAEVLSEAQYTTGGMTRSGEVAQVFRPPDAPTSCCVKERWGLQEQPERIQRH